MDKIDELIVEMSNKIAILENKIEHIEQMRLLDKINFDQKILAIKLERNMDKHK